MRQCVPVVGMPGRGVLAQGRSRIGRAAFSVGLLVALRVVGESRGERAGAEQHRCGGSEGYGSVAKHGGVSLLWFWLRWRSRRVTPVVQVSTHPSGRARAGCRTRRTLPRAPIAAGDLKSRFLRA